MNQPNKPFGMYNSSNPMINGTTKDEINSLLESYFNDKSSSIQNDICTVATNHLASLLNDQNDKIANIRESLQDIYTVFLSKINNEILSSFSANSSLMNQECHSLKNSLDEYEYKVKAVNQYNREIPDIDAMIEEVNELIAFIKSNAVLLDNNSEKSSEEIDLNNVYNDLLIEMNQLNNKILIPKASNDSIFNKATVSINEAQRKLKVVKSSSDNQQQLLNGNIHSIRQFKRKNIY